MYRVIIRQFLANAAKGDDPRLMEAAIKLPLLLPQDTNDKGTLTFVIEGG
jgi:hypothetical protein